MIESLIFKKAPSGAFSGSVVGTFAEPDVVERVVAFPGIQFQRISTIAWCCNTMGGVKLFWNETGDQEIPFVVLSGNGRWDLGTNPIPVTPTSDGTLLISVDAVDDLDSFTLIITGETVV